MVSDYLFLGCVGVFVPSEHLGIRDKLGENVTIDSVCGIPVLLLGGGGI